MAQDIEKLSKIPGPCEYDTNYARVFKKNNPEAFGSTSFMDERPLSEPRTALSKLMKTNK